jgi:hypothetical protein
MNDHNPQTYDRQLLNEPNRSPDYPRSSAVQVLPLCLLCLCGEFFGLVASLRFFAERWR